MLCPTCNQELSFTGVCPRCGPLTANSGPAQPEGDPFAGTVAQLPARRKSHPLLSVLAFLMWVATLGLALLESSVLLRSKSGPRTFDHFVAFFIGAFGFPVLIGVVVTMLINRRKESKMTAAQKSSCTAGIALVFSFFGLVGASEQHSRFRHSDPKKEMARLLAEASGKSPVSPDSDWWDDLMRDFFRSVIDRNKRYSQEIRELDTSAMKHLYSPESYSSKEGMRKTIDQVQAALQLDQKYGTARPLVQELEIKLRNVDASQSEKDDFLKGVNSSAGIFLGSQDKLMDLEQKWVDATITLYQFTIDHRADYSIRGKELFFRNDAARLEFVAKQKDAIAERRAFLDEKAGLDRMRNNTMTEIGLASQDSDPAPYTPTQK